jgi:hypothetical protein
LGEKRKGMVHMVTMTDEKKKKVLQIPNDQWKTIAEAAQHFGVSVSKIRSTQRDFGLEIRKDPMDSRVSLIDLDELRRIYGRK